MRDCWPVFQVANKEKTLKPRLLALHFPVVLWYKWSRQAHHLSLTNLLPAKTINVKWLGFSGSKKWNSKLPFPGNQGLSRAKAKTRNFPILDFFLGGGVGAIFGGILRNSKQLSPQNQGWSRTKAKTHHFPMRGDGSKFSVNFVQDCSVREKRMRYARARGEKYQKLNLPFFSLSSCVNHACHSWLRRNRNGCYTV